MSGLQPLPHLTARDLIDLSVVAPAHNEEANVEPLAKQVELALKPVGLSWELLVVDDGSTDSTRQRLQALMPTRPWLRVVAMQKTPPGKGNGQSAAFHAGFRAARGRLIAVLDADLQNDPADLPKMLTLLSEQNADMVQGDRSHARQDNAVRKIGSIVGRTFRRWLLADTIRDTGCSLRVMKREIALALPLQFRGIHRFIPVSARHLGFKVVEMPVNHRPRVAGETKYGLGITKRAIPGLIDLLAVRWMRSRRRPIDALEVAAPAIYPQTPMSTLELKPAEPTRA
jgi:dolichol-phosphate mannosyltransferase